MTDDQQHTTVTGFVAFEPIKGVYRLQFSRTALRNKLKYLEDNIFGFRQELEKDHGGKQLFSGQFAQTPNVAAAGTKFAQLEGLNKAIQEETISLPDLDVGLGPSKAVFEKVQPKTGTNNTDGAKGAGPRKAFDFGRQQASADSSAEASNHRLFNSI